jgi:hypothetical protein
MPNQRGLFIERITLAKKQTKFKRSRYAPQVYNFNHYMDNFYLEKSTETLTDAMRALRLIPSSVRVQSRAIYNFEKAALKFCRRMDTANNLSVGEYIRSLNI